MSTRSREIIFLALQLERCVGLTTLPPSVSRLSRQCGILNISQPYMPLRPVTGLSLLSFYCELAVIQFGCHKWTAQKYPVMFKVIETSCHWAGSAVVGHAEWQFPCLQGQEWREEWALSMPFPWRKSEYLCSQIKHREVSEVSNSVYKHRS
jgi:hypothetical protein